MYSRYEIRDLSYTMDEKIKPTCIKSCTHAYRFGENGGLLQADLLQRFFDLGQIFDLHQEQERMRGSGRGRMSG